MGADDNAVCGFCKRGKRRRQGTDPGFHFAIPKLNSLPLDFTGQWQHVYTQLASGQDQEVCPFLVLDFQSSTGILEQAQISGRPMSYAKFAGALRGTLMALGASADQSSNFTFNSLRRVWPTACQFFSLAAGQAQAVSNWQKVPESATDGDTPRSLQRASFPMSRR